MELSLENKNIIVQDSERCYPKECCGLLVDIENKVLAISCKNTSLTPEKSFIIDSEQIKKYGLENIVGFYHSHKDNREFTLGDMAFSEKLNKFCVLYIVDSKELKIYEPNGFLIPYVGRPMFPGFLDCVSLSQDFYKRELNIIFKNDLTHPLRYDHASWTEQKETIIQTYGYVDIIGDYLSSNNFQQVSSIKKYDILLFKMPTLPTPSHIGIYLENNQLLHHFYEFSEQENYSNAFKRTLIKIYRHQSLL